MKRKPNWKLMSDKDRAKFKAKHPAVALLVQPSSKGGRARSKKPMFMSVKESKTRVKEARIPRDQWTRTAPNKEMGRVVL